MLTRMTTWGQQVTELKTSQQWQGFGTAPVDADPIRRGGLFLSEGRRKYMTKLTVTVSTPTDAEIEKLHAAVVAWWAAKQEAKP